MNYKRKKITKDIQDCVDQGKISTFYQNKMVKYLGRTSDTKELYTEVIAEWLLGHLNQLKQIEKITRDRNYFVRSHNGYTKANNSQRAEERIAMALFRRRTFKSVGEIIDYQTPLKDMDNPTNAGKIDLLSCDGNIARILELKRPDGMGFENDKLVPLKRNQSGETMLRCGLEGYTYLETIKDQIKFKKDLGIPDTAILKTSPLVFYGSTQWKEMQDPECKNLRELMRVLDIEPFYITGDKETNFDIVK